MTMAQTTTPRSQYMQRKSELWQERSSWIDHWRELSQYVKPRTGRFLVTDRNKGLKRNEKIIDSTATRAHRVLGAGLMAGMTSPARPWFKLALADTDLMEYQPVKEWLADTTTKMRNVFARSNTYRALHMIYEEEGLYGTGASIVLDDFQDVMRHYPLTAGEYAIATDDRGVVNTIYREFDMTVAQMAMRFGEKALSATTRGLLNNGKAKDTWRTVLHVIQPRKNYDPRGRLAKEMKFASCYMEVGRDDNMQGFLKESGFKTFPALCPRWHASGGDIYGNSPGMEALGDIKQLQHGQTRKMQAIDYSIKPPLQIPSSLKNSPLSTLPGGSTYVDMSAGTQKISSMWDVRTDISGQLEDIRDVRQRINETFYVDLFLMLAQADQGAPVTAREVAEKHEEKLLMLGPVLEGQFDELLRPKIDMTFDRVLEAGILRPPPPELQNVDLNVEFVSMLAQAQRAIGVQGLDRMVQTIGTIATFQANAGMNPDAMDKINVDDAIDAYADMLGVDPALIVGSDKVAIVRANRAKEAQQQQQLVNAQAAADTASKLAGANTGEQNALTDVISQFSGYTGPGVAVAA